MARHAFLVSFLALLCTSASLGQTTVVSDPQALALAQKSMAALTGGQSILDVTLSANVAGLEGSDIETGTATLVAKGLVESRTDYKLSGGNRSEVRSSPSGLPQGAWSGPTTKASPIAMHNSWTNASWFFPALSDLSAANPGVALSYVGLENRLGVSVQHLQSRRLLISNLNLTTTTLTQQLSSMDFYLDATSLLPVVIAFKVHPDDNANVDIPVEIRFSNYQKVADAQVAMHIQKYVNNGITLDLVITGVSLNNGVLDGIFSAP